MKGKKAEPKGGQKEIAKKAPPKDKITKEDFKKLRNKSKKKESSLKGKKKK